MRVLLSPRRRGEEGAVAVLVALMATFLLVISAFTIDLGQAIVSKRQLQTAADAGALAAASEYALTTGTCAQLQADGALRASAETAADGRLALNELSSLQDNVTGQITDVTCVDGRLKVRYSTQGTTTAFLSGLTGSGSTISTNRLAAATVGVGTSGTGLRPLALCSADLPANGLATGQIVKVNYPGGGFNPPDTCPFPNGPSGNWWTIDCPGERTGSMNTGMTTQVRNGCPEEVTVIPGQESYAGNPSGLSTFLTNACPSAPEGSATCLSGDPGSLDGGQVAGAWNDLLATGTRFLLPVFCAPPTCTPTTLTGTGTTAVFPVHKIIAVVVCGYHFSDNEEANSTVGDCAAPHEDATAASGNQDNFLILKYVTILSSGSSAPSTCQLGSACDNGVRTLFLSE